MIKVLSIHVTGPGLSGEQRFLIEARGGLESYRLNLVERMNDEIAALDAALDDDYLIIASSVIESDQGKAFWFVLHRE